jgi:phage terminase large subunit-like protein
MVRDGELIRPVLPILYELPTEMQKRRPGAIAGLAAGQPEHGPRPRRERLGRFRGCRAKGKDKLILFASQHLNVQIGIGLKGDAWRGADYWEGAAFEEIRSLDVLLARSEVVVIGIDGGGLDDLFGLCVLGRDRKTKVWLYWFHAWAHRKVLDPQGNRAEPARFRAGRRPDLLGQCRGEPGLVAARLKASDEAAPLEGDDRGAEDPPRGRDVDEDVAQIVAVCVKVRESGLLPDTAGIGVDPAASARWSTAWSRRKFSVGDQVTGKGDIFAVSQSAMNMFSAINTMERKLEAGSAAHGGTAMMAWCVGNAKAEQRGNAVLITKQAAGKAKIDPLVAGSSRPS